jgi:hypothetical protein
MTKINAIRQQRPDRISNILNGLEENGYIKSIIDDVSKTKLYLITETSLESKTLYTDD